MNNELMSVTHENNIDLATSQITSNVYVRVYSSLFTTGIVARLGTNASMALLALATFMDNKGECYPTQIQLADALGVHRNSINRYINELLDFRINGKPLVTRQKINKGNGEIYSYYTINPLSQLAKFDGQIEGIESHKSSFIDTDNGTDKCTSISTNISTDGCAVIRSNNKQLEVNNNNTITANSGTKKVTLAELQKEKRMAELAKKARLAELEEKKRLAELEKNKFNSSKALKLFSQLYEEKYEVPYLVSNFARTHSFLAQRVTNPFPDHAEMIIRIAVTKYDELFATPDYPRPTIGMFSWAANKIIPIIEAEEKRSAITNNASEAEELAEQRMLAKMGAL